MRFKKQIKNNKELNLMKFLGTIRFYIEAVAQRCSIRKVFEKICKIRRITPVPESFF